MAIRKFEVWEEFLAALKAAGGSTNMQTSATGRYPWAFHFQRGLQEQLGEVVVYADLAQGDCLHSPPRDWSTESAIKADYQALWEAGGKFNDSKDCLGLES